MAFKSNSTFLSFLIHLLAAVVLVDTNKRSNKGRSERRMMLFMFVVLQLGGGLYETQGLEKTPTLARKDGQQ